MADDSATRIGIALRAAHIAHQALELMSLSSVRLCMLQMLEITNSMQDLHSFLNESMKGEAK